jgi:hypothetical protein
MNKVHYLYAGVQYTKKSYLRKLCSGLEAEGVLFNNGIIGTKLLLTLKQITTELLKQWNSGFGHVLL